MKTKINTSILALSVLLVSTSIHAKQCDNSGYDYRLGHRAIDKGLTLPKSEAQLISVCLDYTVPSDWRNAISSGIVKLRSELSSVNTSLNFQGGYLVDAGNIDDLEYRGCDVGITYQHGLGSENAAITDGQGIASGFTKIAINAHMDEDRKNEGTQFSKNLMEYVIIHELLHTIGLFHTGDLNSDYSPYIDIKEIPGTDGYWQTKFAGTSIMCPSFDPNNDAPSIILNSIDRQALEYLYPR